MKYFVDFEAAQYTKEILSIGCVREDGKSFYSLVRPKRLKALTTFITELTGITKEMLKDEKSSDEVFSDFFDWLICEDNGAAEFYCYGNVDIDFLKKNLEDRTSNFKAQAALSMIAMGLTDYSEKVKEHFGLIQCVALKKVMNYYYPENNSECHNALSDAEMLYKIYLKVENEENVYNVPFPKYMGKPKKREDFRFYKIERIADDGTSEMFESLDDAIDYIKDLLSKQKNSNFKEKTIEEKLIKATFGEKYFNQKWVAHLKVEEDDDLV